jgi:hypothetical protein
LRNDQAATLYYVEAIDGNQKIKSILERCMAMESAFNENASLMLKTNNAFLALFGKCNYRNCF